MPQPSWRSWDFRRSGSRRRPDAGARLGRSPAVIDDWDRHRDGDPQSVDERASRRRCVLCGVVGLRPRPIPHGYRRESRAVDRRDRAGAIPQAAGGDRVVLDALDNAEQPVPVDARVLAALGPKMLALAAERARGAHPYLITPEHTHSARELLGDGPLLLPEQTAILTDDADEARTIGTGWLRMYLAMPNYANSLLRLGFSAEDVGSVSDRLFDATHRVGRRGRRHAAGERAPVRGCGPRVCPGSRRRPQRLPA